MFRISVQCYDMDKSESVADMECTNMSEQQCQWLFHCICALATKISSTTNVMAMDDLDSYPS